MPTAEGIKKFRNPFPTTDIVIEHYDAASEREGIVLIERRNPPRGLALPGGFAEWGLSLEENAVKEAREETGLEVKLHSPEHPLCVKSDPSRDSRGHMISVTYVGRGYGTLRKGDFDDARNPALYTLPEVAGLVKSNALVFDHAEILREYLKSRGYKRYETLGLVARFKPLHNGAARMLEAVCNAAEHVIIGIGSCNRHDNRNPFTADETEAMLHAYLKPRHSNYRIVRLDDYGHLPQYADGKRWTDEAITRFGRLDGFVTSNPYVAELLSPAYNIVHPASLIPQESWVKLNATMVRGAMAQGDGYKSMVPKEVALYIEKNGLAERFRREFGSIADSYASDTLDAEMKKVRGERVSGLKRGER